MKSLYFYFRNLISSTVHRHRWAMSLAASFFVIGFVTLTAIPVLVGLNAFYTEDQSNIYNMRIRPGTISKDMHDSLNSILDRYPNANIKLFSPCANSPFSYVIGQNDQRDGMDIAGQSMKGNLSDKDKIVWLGQGFWDTHRALRLPQVEVLIGTDIFHVVGITEPRIYDSLTRTPELGLPAITNLRGEMLPIYDFTGKLYDNSIISPKMAEMGDDDHEDHGTVHYDYGYTWEYPFFSAVIPLATQLSMDLPVSDLTLFLSQAPSDSDHDWIIATLSDFMDIVPEKPYNPFQFSISQILGLVIILATALCLFQLVNTVWFNLQTRDKQLYALFIVGYAHWRIALMLLIETLVWQCVGFALCILPASAVIHLATLYANPRISITPRDIVWVWIGNLILACVWYLSIALIGLNKIRKSRG